VQSAETPGPCVGARGISRSSIIAGTTALGLMALMAVGVASSTVYIGRLSFDAEVISGRSRVEF